MYQHGLDTLHTTHNTTVTALSLFVVLNNWVTCVTGVTYKWWHQPFAHDRLNFVIYGFRVSQDVTCYDIMDSNYL